MNIDTHRSQQTLISRGFSLIELMIVITIIGILAAVAVPAYNQYVIRASITEAYVILQSYHQRAAEYYQINGIFPPLSYFNPAVADTVTSGLTTDSRVYYERHSGTKSYYMGFTTPAVANSTCVDGGGCAVFMVGNADSNNVVTTYCGPWALPVWDHHVGEEFLPGSCKVILGSCFGNLANC